jgi:hypothetical protein
LAPFFHLEKAFLSMKFVGKKAFLFVIDKENMAGEERRKPGGAAKGSIIDARATNRGDLAARQRNRPSEDILTAHEVTEEDVLLWKKTFRDHSGFKQTSQGEIRSIRGAMQNKFGELFKSRKISMPDSSFAYNLERLRAFVLNTRQEVLNHSLISVEFRDAFQRYREELEGTQKIFSLLMLPTENRGWIIDDATKKYLTEIYKRLRENTAKKLPSIVIWQKYNRYQLESNDVRVAFYKAKSDVPSAQSILISNAYYLTRVFLPLTEDEATRTVLQEFLDTVKELAQNVEEQKAKLAEVDVKVDAFSDVSEQHRDEATQIWQELLAA